MATCICPAFYVEAEPLQTPDMLHGEKGKRGEIHSIPSATYVHESVNMNCYQTLF